MGGVAGGWRRWVLREMEWWVRLRLKIFGLYRLRFLGMACRLALKKFLAYKLSLKDSISKWTLRGKYAKSDVIKTLKLSL